MCVCVCVCVCVRAFNPPTLTLESLLAKTPVERTYTENKLNILQAQTCVERTLHFLSLSLSLSHTHTHTHTQRNNLEEFYFASRHFV